MKTGGKEGMKKRGKKGRPSLLTMQEHDCIARFNTLIPY
jgi:hypothetical protein